MSEHLPYIINEAESRNHFYETLWKRSALDLLNKYNNNPQGMTFLDYGCGRGETMRLAQDLGYEVTGADVDDVCLELSGRWGATIKITAGDTGTLPDLLCKKFDVVTCFHVLEHVPNPLALLLQLKQLSNKYLLLAVPNLRQLHGLRRSPYLLNDINMGHLQGWDHGHFLNITTRHAGLKLVEWTSDTVILPILSELVVRTFGMHAAIKCETGLFRKWFPYHSISIIGLFEQT